MSGGKSRIWEILAAEPGPKERLFLRFGMVYAAVRAPGFFGLVGWLPATISGSVAVLGMLVSHLVRSRARTEGPAAAPPPDEPSPPDATAGVPAPLAPKPVLSAGNAKALPVDKERGAPTDLLR